MKKQRRFPTILNRELYTRKKQLFSWLLFGCLLIASTLAIAVKMAPLEVPVQPQITKQTWPKGTFLSHIKMGARVLSYHRGFLYMHSLDNTSVWDMSNPANPLLVDEVTGGENGHRWWKWGDLFYREYTVPETKNSNYKFMDLSNMLNRVPWSKPAPFPITKGQDALQDLETFPITIDGNNVNDMRTGQLLAIGNFSAAPNQELKIRIGNLLLFAGSGAAAYDIGDPKNPKLLDVLIGNFNQYTTTVHVWRNYLIYMNGDNSNEGGNNLVAIDFKDPTDLKYAFGVKLADSPGRYMFFQDEYGYTGRATGGVKLNLETLEVEQRFNSPGHPLQFSDFQWVPMGHVLVASGAESGTGETFFFAHQDGLDKKAPYVSFHNPVVNATSQPISTVVGFVINETLDDLTLNDKTIQVTPLDGSGQPIAGDVISSSYNAINFVPKAPLKPNTTYEVKFAEGGIKDVAGNGIKEYTYRFSTGSAVNPAIPPAVSSVTHTPVSPIVKGTAITFKATATTANSGTLQYRWDFGDGTEKTAWATSNQINYTYTKAGNYSVAVQVRDALGNLTTKINRILVVDAQGQTSPTQSSQIVVDATKRKVWAVNPDNNSVTILNADTHAVIKEVAVGKHPTSVALDSKGQVWVTCREDSKLTVLSATDGSVVGTVAMPYGSQPFHMVFTPDGNTGFVSEYATGKLIKINPTTRTITGSVTLEQSVSALAVTSDGAYVLATRFISPDEGGQVFKVNAATLALMATITLPVDNTSEDSGANGRGLPNYVAGIAINPANTKAWTVAKKDNILRGLNKDGNPLTFETTVRCAISSLNLATNTETLTERKDIDNHAQPSALTFSPLGTHLFIAMQGNNRVIVLDPANGNEITRIDVGLAPQGIAVDPTTKKVFVNNFMGRSVTVLDAADMINNGSATLTKLATVKTIAAEVLSAQVLKGKQLFYNAEDLRMGMDGYLTCATCHNDDEHDGRTWDFTDRGEGLRNTISLKGRAGTGQGRVHWSANFDEIQDFEHDIRGPFAGKGFMTDADFNTGKRNKPLGDAKAGVSTDLNDIDALAAYLQSLETFDASPYRAAGGTLTTDAAAGKTLFSQLKCNNCHTGAGFTDSPKGLLHDVGTIVTTSGKRSETPLKGLDTPTLRDLWSTAPYLHDGSAKTLKDVLTTRNNGGHGTGTASLTTTQVTQLVAYLQQIDGSETAAAAGIDLSLSSPTNGATFNVQAAIPLQINTTITGITKVEYYANDKLVAQSTTAPFSASWTPTLWGDHKLQAKVIYNGSKTATLSPENKITYKRGMKALFVVGNTVLNYGDNVVKQRLLDRGFEVSLIDDDIVNKPDATGMDIILMSSTIDPNKIGEDLTHNLPVPVVSWDPFSYQHLRLCGRSYDSDFGFTPTASKTLLIPDLLKDHPMAAGYSGTVPLYTVLQTIGFGKPSEGDAIVLATVNGKAIIYGNDKKEGNSAPSHRLSRKVAFPLRDDFIHLFTAEGWALFDGAIDWAIYGGKTGLQPLTDITILSPQEGATVRPTFQVSFQTDNWDLSTGGNQVQYFLDGQQAGLTQQNAPIQFNNLSVGLHTITLALADKAYILTGVKKTIRVNVSSTVPSEPTLSIVSPANNATVSTPFSVSFAVTNWEMAPLGKNLRYFIDGVDQGAVYNTNPIQIAALSNGAHTIKLQLANANQSLTTIQQSISVTVAPPPPPSVAITSPANNATVSLPFALNFGVQNWPMAPNGRSLHYFIDGVDKGTVFTTSPISITGLTPGLHTLKVQLAEADGTLQTASSSVSVTVSSAPPPPSVTKLAVEYRPNNTGTSVGSIEPNMRIVNDSTASFAYKDLTIRYWYTLEGNAAQEFNISYAQVGNSNITGTFTQVSGSLYYLEVGFATAAGNLAGNSTSGDISLRWNKVGWSSHDQTNDYSFAANAGFARSPKITLYHKGTKVWGTEPTTGARMGVAAVLDQQLQVYPVPVAASHPLYLDYAADQGGDVQVQWYNAAGSVVLTHRKAVSKGLNTLSLQSGHLPSGVYTLRIVAGREIVIKRITVE